MRRTREATREHIVDCAMRLYSEQGFENVSFHDIASASGVDNATVTRNFGDADGLMNAVAGRFAASRLDTARLESRMAKAGEDEDLLVHLTYYYDCFFESIHFLRLYFMENVNQGSRRLHWPLLEEMRASLAASIWKKGIKTQEDTVETVTGLLVDFVAKSVWRANIADGCRESTAPGRSEFAALVQPHIDVCLMTLLPE